MKRFNFLLLLIVMISLVTVASAEDPQYETVTKMAEDTDCRAACHSQDPHVIHEPTPASCIDCHGAKLDYRTPQCLKCHTGSIHNVHVKKVLAEDCSYCHEGLDNIHLDMMSNTVCKHCHGQLLKIHGGPEGIEAESCDECHGIKPNVVAPIKSETDVIVCEACHKSADVAILHGEVTDVNSCYRCHRPGSVNVSASEIPHFIHVPDVDCKKCHIDENTEKIMIPACPMCHNAADLHAYNKIALKTPNTGLRCSVCHPMVEDDIIETATIAPTGPPAEATETDEKEGVPGFGIFLMLAAVTVAYLARRR